LRALFVRSHCFREENNGFYSTLAERQSSRRNHRLGNWRELVLQGVEYYKNTPRASSSRLMHVDLGGYHINYIEFVAPSTCQGKGSARTSQRRVGLPNNTIKFCDVPKTGVKVSRGMTHDGLGKNLSQNLEKGARPTDDVVAPQDRVSICVYSQHLTVGSEKASSGTPS